MAKLDSRLNRLEVARRADPADPHASCLELFQVRVISSDMPDAWEDDAVLPETRPTDGTLYPPLQCFHGPAEACPHRRWADYSYKRDKHLHGLRDLPADLGEVGPEPTPETLEHQARAVAAYRGRAAAELPRLEAKLDARLKPTRT